MTDYEKNHQNKSENSTLAYYRENAKNLAKRYETAQMDNLNELLLKWLPEKSASKEAPEILELGCGSGREAAFLLSQGYDVIGIDGSLNLIEEAKKFHPELGGRLFCRTIPDELNFDRKFDALISIAVLMHFDEKQIEVTLRKATGLLRQKGRFIFSVCIERTGLENGFDIQQRRFTLLSSDKWKELCDSAGLKIIHEKINSDGLNRGGVEWLSCVCQKRE